MGNVTDGNDLVAFDVCLCVWFVLKGVRLPVYFIFPVKSNL